MFRLVAEQVQVPTIPEMSRQFITVPNLDLIQGFIGSFEVQAAHPRRNVEAQTADCKRYLSERFHVLYLPHADVILFNLRSDSQVASRIT